MTAGGGVRRAWPAVLEALPDRVESTPALALELEGLQPIAAALGREFTRPALLRAALTLGSWINEHPDAGWTSNACLEFFGDAVLDLVAAEALWRRFPDVDEGQLTRLRASLVAEASLAAAARAIGLDGALFCGRGDRLGGVDRQDGVLADALEAILAAVFFDARGAGEDPLAVVAAVFERLFGDQLRGLTPADGLDVKSRLQQRVQATKRLTPIYEPIGERAPIGGAPRWAARVIVRSEDGAVEVLGEGTGRSRRLAERAAAAAALRRLDAVGERGAAVDKDVSQDIS